MTMLSDVTSAAAEAARGARRRLFHRLIAFGFGLMAFGFANAAAVIALIAELGGLGACLIMAGFYAFLFLLVLAFRAGHAEAASHRPAEKKRPSDEDAIAQLVATFLSGVRAMRTPPSDRS